MTNPRKKPTTAHLPGQATTPRSIDGKFAKNAPRPANSGRAKGKRNRTTIMLKEAILTAADLAGADGKGRDGMVGYLRMLAIRERHLFSRLLEKVLPMQLDVKDDAKQVYSPEQAASRLRERGLPVPPSLIQLTTVAHALVLQRENTDEPRQRDELDDLED